jgi:hypothetical protein
MMVVDFSPEVDRRVAHHWCVMLHRAGGHLAPLEERVQWTVCKPQMAHASRQGARILCGWLTPPLLGPRIDGSNNELVDIMTPLLRCQG